MRLPWPALAGGAVIAALGVAGLVLGARPQTASGGSGGSSASSGAPIVVSGAYMHPPVAPNKTAAAYFTVDNTTSRPDRLTSVVSGAGGISVLHTIAPDGSMQVAANGVVIPAHGTLRLSPGKGHVMIEHLYGTLRVGQTVNLELDFNNAGPLDVAARVVPLGVNTPVSSTTPSGGHS